MQPHRREKLRPALLLLLLPALLASLACLGDGGGGLLSTIDFADEDFSRPNPRPSLEGALTQQCDAEPTPQHYQTAQALERALCLCGDFDNVGTGLTTRSFSRVHGNDTGLAHVGINGSLNAVGNLTVEGDLDVARGLDGVGDITVARDLITGGSVDIVGDWGVGRDAWIEGDLDVVGNLLIGNDLYLAGGFDAVGDVTYNTARRGFTYGGAPCGCASNQLLNVTAEVRARKDAATTAALPSGVGSSDVVLRSGEYYVANPRDLVGSGSITIDGKVGLFVDGDLDTVGSLNIELAPGGELDLWVAGSIKTVGNLQFADERDLHARAFRLFVGGPSSAIIQVGDATFYGSIYAPEADIEYVGDLTVYGSLFADNLEGTGSLAIYYDTDVAAPDPCAEAQPEPVGDRCDANDDCSSGEACDSLAFQCGAPRQCDSTDDCPNGRFCIEGQCTGL